MGNGSGVCGGASGVVRGIERESVLVGEPEGFFCLQEVQFEGAR